MEDFLTVWETFVGLPLTYDTLALHVFAAGILFSLLDMFVYCVQRLLRRV